MWHRDGIPVFKLLLLSSKDPYHFVLYVVRHFCCTSPLPIGICNRENELGVWRTGRSVCFLYVNATSITDFTLAVMLSFNILFFFFFFNSFIVNLRDTSMAVWRVTFRDLGPRSLCLLPISQIFYTSLEVPTSRALRLRSMGPALQSSRFM